MDQARIQRKGPPTEKGCNELFTILRIFKHKRKREFRSLGKTGQERVGLLEHAQYPTAYNSMEEYMHVKRPIAMEETKVSFCLL